MLLVLAALIPAVVLIIYIYRMDRVEREPKGVILKLFLLGALSTLPAVIVEIVLESLLGRLLVPETFLYHLISSFVIVAGAEEFSGAADRDIRFDETAQPWKQFFGGKILPEPQNVCTLVLELCQAIQSPLRNMLHRGNNKHFIVIWSNSQYLLRYFGSRQCGFRVR